MAGPILMPEANTIDLQEVEERTEGTRTYAIIVCIFSSLGGMFFGYDQGVTGGVLVMDSFLKDFCVGYDDNTMKACSESASKLPENWLTFTTLYNVTYYLGCIFGAFAGGWVADKFGRRVTIFNAGLLFCIGTTWVIATPAGQHSVILIGRVVQGMGVGNSSFSLPLFGAEVAPKELRGLLSGFMQMTVVTGLLLANIVNVIVENVGEGWRITNGVALVPPLIVMLGIFCVPESPRWLYKTKGKEAAEEDLKRLRQTDNVQRELQAIGDQIAIEGAEAPWSELVSPLVRKRVMIAMVLQLLQQATGINPVFTYGGQIFKDVTGKGILSLLILTIVNFVSTIPAMRWVDTCGRRQLLLIGAVGMFLGHLISAITFTSGCGGNTAETNCSITAGYIMIVASAFFVFNFAISWGPVCWIYPAEIFPLHVRAKAVSLSTMTNWGMGALMIGIPKLFPYLNINGVFFLFAALCICCFVFVYYMCPETKGLLLEEIEVLFGIKISHEEAMRSPKYVGVGTPI
jgi:SP family sugar:H+ symporter-like MFS transporter